MVRPGGRGGKLPAPGILADLASGGVRVGHQTLRRGSTGCAPERERDTVWDLFGPRWRPGESAVVPLGVGHASRMGAPRTAICGGDDPAFLITSFAAGARYVNSGGRAVSRVRCVARAWSVVAGVGPSGGLGARPPTWGASVAEHGGGTGGTLIKAGQFASTRPDLLPAPFVATLASLQDRVPPRSATVIEGALASELGRPVSEVFSEFDATPVAAASIAQVHRARLADGREVAVKVQYPGVGTLMDSDLDALEVVFETVVRLEPEIDLQPVADYLRWTLPLELDFRREAEATVELRRALCDRDDILIPKVIENLTTERLLVMELAEGVRITDTETLVGAGISPREVALLLNDVYADQLFRRAVLHADPHPGNLLVQHGPRLVLLDHGLTLALEPHSSPRWRGW